MDIRYDDIGCNQLTLERCTSTVPLKDFIYTFIDMFCPKLARIGFTCI